MEKEIRQILFPTTKILTSSQVNDVEHLKQHVLPGDRAFITLNTNDFIKKAKQTALAQLGIWVFTPQELVELLNRIYSYV